MTDKLAAIERRLKHLEDERDIARGLDGTAAGRALITEGLAGT